MDPGTKAALFMGVGVVVLVGGWGLVRWLASWRDDPTASEGTEAEDPAETEGPPASSSSD